MNTGDDKERRRRRWNWNWALPAFFLLMGVSALESGITGRGHYDDKHKYYYSAEEDLAVAVVCLLCCGYSVFVLQTGHLKVAPKAMDYEHVVH
jgi:hypothetical protein